MKKAIKNDINHISYCNQNNYPDSVVVFGGKEVSGKIKVSGSKIASIPIIAATILSKETILIKNIPNLKDIRVLIHLISKLGGQVSWSKDVLIINNKGLKNLPLSAEIVSSVHGTIYLIPTLLARFGKVSIARSVGGCQIGERPIKHIIEVLRSFGSDITVKENNVVASATHLMGSSFSAVFSDGFDKFRSGITKAFLLAGICASGRSTLTNAYTRASVIELVKFLKILGAKITGEGTQNIEIIESEIGGGNFTVAGDYLEALTFVSCVAACGGELTIEGFDVNHCEAELELFQKMGLELKIRDDKLVVKKIRRSNSVKFTTLEIDTDIQQIISVVLATSIGKSIVKEEVWENRFQYVGQVNKMGANFKVFNNELTINGVDFLAGANVHAGDLRAAAALLIAAAAAKGKSVVSGLTHLDRGYSHFLEKLSSININFQEN
ncbi:MAG: UDP-N-acetylglucosamine 1-carboxyvinyltransferase [Chitinophagaceae bacterium]